MRTTKQTQTQVTKLDGAPGTGKTTELLNIIHSLVAKGYDLSEDLLFLTFSTAARKDAQKSIKDEFDVELKTAKGTTSTVHGAALSQVLRDGVVDGEETDIITENGDPDVFKQFFRETHPDIRYSTNQKDALKKIKEGEEKDAAIGNKIISAYNYLRAKDWDFKYNDRTPVTINKPRDRVAEIMADWQKWKEENKYLQHNDYVHLACEYQTRPDVDVLLIDEFQDLSPLQYKLYKNWRDSGSLDEIYIAGDVDQSIYSFRGAEPEYFRETDHDDLIDQTKSWRCPSKICDAANKILQDDAVEARQGTGAVQHTAVDGKKGLCDIVATELDNISDDGRVFVLARTRRQCASATNAFINRGIAYRGLSSSFYRWAPPTSEIYNVVRRTDRGLPIPTDAAEEFLDHVPRMAVDEDIKALAHNNSLESAVDRDIKSSSTENISPQQWREWLDAEPTAANLLSVLDLDEWRRKIIKNALASSMTHAPQDLRIGTLHAAKGLEAESVILLPDYTYKMLERYEEEMEAEERRLYYVGATRASERLIIPHGVFDSEEFPPLSR